MTVSELLANADFWAALFGALAAFLLGMTGQWWAANRDKAAAGNLAMITLAQMYAQLENLRYQLLVEEATRAARELESPDPFSIYLRPAIGLPQQELTLKIEQLGFLVGSHDPDVLNRLLTIERQFTSMIDLVHRHRELHTEFQERMSRIDPTGQRQIALQTLPQLVGGPLIYQLDDAIEGLVTGLPETRDNIIAVSSQLRRVLRMQLPGRRFLSFKGTPRSGLPCVRPDAPKPALWRRAARTAVDFLVKRRAFATQGTSSTSETKDPTGPRIRRITGTFGAPMGSTAARGDSAAS